MKTKKPVVAWVTNAKGFDGLDGVSVVGARTEAGARGYTRRAIIEAGFLTTPGQCEIALEHLGALDEWIAKGDRGTVWMLAIAVLQDQDARKEAMGDALTATLAAMRKDGQGLASDQEATIRRGLGLA